MKLIRYDRPQVNLPSEGKMNDITLLEKFIFSQDKQTVLEELKPFKEKYQFFSLLFKIHQNKETLADIEEFQRLYPQSEEKDSVLLKHLFKKLSSSSQDERKVLIDLLNKLFFNEDFNDVQQTEFDIQQDQGEKVQFSSVLSEQEFESLTEKKFIEDLYQNPESSKIHQINNSTFLSLDFEKFLAMDQACVTQINSKLTNFVNIGNKSILKYLGALCDHEDLEINICTLNNILSQFPFEDHSNFLKKQNLFEDKQCFQQLYLRAFEEINYKDSHLCVEEIRELTRQRVKFIEEGPSQFRINTQILRRNLLLCLCEREVADEDLFLQYLKQPFERENHLKESLRQVPHISTNNFVPSYSNGKSLMDILELTLVQHSQTEIKVFEEYFDKNQLEKLVFRLKFFKGEHVDLQKHYQEREIKEMNEKKILQVKGKETFRENEEVVLNLRMKNIKKLNVKVFEVNTENFIRNKDLEDYNSIVVDFLIPSEEYSYSFSHPSALIHDQTLKFERIQGQKLGVFIVNIIGDEMLAKAIIKKGRIALLYDEICGRKCAVVDENQSVLKGENTGIYIQNKLLKCDPSTGIIHVPESIASFSNEVTVVHNGFAVKQYLATKDYNYELKFSPFFNNEELIAGRQARFIIPIKLTLNNGNVSLKLLQNTSIEIVFQKSGGVTQKKQYSDLQLSDSEDLVLEAIIPSKLERVTFQLKSQIQRKELIHLSDFYQSDFARPNLLQGKYTTLCQNEKKEYYIKIIGSNGEPLSKNKVQVFLSFSNYRNSQGIEMVTDFQGEIHLGKLTGCTNVEVTNDRNNFSVQVQPGQEWSRLPSEVLLLENEKVEINNPENVQLMKYSVDRGFTKNLFSYIRNENKLIKIEGLEQGNYTITFENNHTMFVRVIKGKYVELNGKKIASQDFLLNKSQHENVMSVDVEETNEEYKLQVKGGLPNSKLHVLLSNYPLSTSNVSQLNCGIQSGSNSNQKYKYSSKESQYFCDGRLNDELVYVMKRKAQKNIMGNTLDKPGTILKRQKVNETVQDNEKLDQGRNFENQERRANYKRCDDRGRLMKACLQSEEVLLDFLQNDTSQPNQVIPNLKVTDGSFTLQKNTLGNYQYVYFLLNYQDGTLVKRLVKNTGEKSKTDLRLKEQRQKGSVFRYSREVDYFSDQSKFTIPHVQKQEFCMLETLEELFEVYKMIYQMDTLDEWKFLATWGKQSSQEKLQKYDKMCSHEFNLFVYFKDRSFFEGVVLPFIRNKKEKTLIDHFLVDDSNELEKKMVISELQNLNVIERSLLYIAASKLNPQFAQIILEESQMQTKLNKISDSEYKRNFDSILQSSKKEEALDEAGGPGVFSNFAPTQMHMQCAPMPRRGPGAMNYSNSPQMMMDNACLQNEMIYEEDCMEMEYNAPYCPEQENVNVFKPTQATVEYEERQFYSSEPGREVIQVYLDFMNHWKKEGSQAQFFSVNFFHSYSELSQVLFLLSILDLPFSKEEYKSELIDGNLQIDIQTRLVCLTKEVIEEQGEIGESKVMLQQKFFDIEDKFVYSEDNPGLMYERPAKEFAIGRVYESALVITNPSSIPIKISVIHEIPQGSVPCHSLDQMKIEHMTVNSLESKTYSMNFYFPEEGEFGCYPATAIDGENILGMAVINEKLTVRKERVLEEVRTLSDALRSGSIDKVEEFLKERNLRDQNVFDIYQLLGLLKNKEFFTRIVTILKSKGYYSRSVWKYSIYHNEENEFKEYLQDQEIRTMFERKTYFLKSDWLEINNFKLLEYHPLVNARAFSLRDEKTEILNNSFRETYLKFLRYLIEKGEPDQRDLIVLGNYLIAQDRIEEALAIQSRVKEEELGEDCRMQWDYQQAYLDFTTGFPDFKKAKEISDKYLTYPVLAWRNLFVEVLNQITEFEEGDENKEQVDQKSKKTEQPSFSASMENSSIAISHRGIQQMIAKFYKVDLEAFYSLRPFGREDFGEAAYVAPFKEERIQLSQQGTTNYLISEELKGENMFIEIKPENGEKSEFLSYSPFLLKHTVSEEFGTVKVIEPESGKPVPKIYMKCFAKNNNGGHTFYKDGFTDIRGSFDFVSLNKDSLDDIQLFKIMICAGQYGFKVVESKAPKKIGKVEGQAKQLISKQWRGMQQQTRYKNEYQNVLL